jgi:phosphatidylglycerophosphate synthase
VEVVAAAAEKMNRRLKSSASPDVPAPRRAEMDDWLNARIFHPLARRLARILAATPATPNSVSVGGGLLIVAAAILYTRLAWPESVLLGFLAHALWHVFDGADGDLARLTGKASPLGELVDGVCDYLGHIVLYVFLAAFLDDWIGGWAWSLASLAGASRIVQSNHAESGRRTYLWRVYDVEWLKHSYERDRGALRRTGLFATLVEPFARAYVRLASAASPLSGRIDALLARASRSPAANERARRICREEGRTPLRLQTVLGPNLRTVALGLAMAAGSPLWFFLLEVTGLNLLMLWSIARQRKADRRIVQRLEGNAAMLGA